jgi:hypothetical protein
MEIASICHRLTPYYHPSLTRHFSLEECHLQKIATKNRQRYHESRVTILDMVERTMIDERANSERTRDERTMRDEFKNGE